MTARVEGVCGGEAGVRRRRDDDNSTHNAAKYDGKIARL